MKRANHRAAAPQSDTRIEWQMEVNGGVESTLKNRCGCAACGYFDTFVKKDAANWAAVVMHSGGKFDCGTRGDIDRVSQRL